MTPLPPHRKAGCPSDLDLERLLVGAAPQLSAHVDGCETCRARTAWAADAARAFVTGPLVRTREAAVAGVLGPKRARWTLWLPAFGLVAAVLLAVVTVPRGPPEDYVGLKGGDEGVGLEVWLGVDGQGQRLSAGAQVHPGDGLRFSLQGPPRRVWLFTVDAKGQVSRLSPATPARATGVLPGGAVLDEVLGPERVFVLDAEAVPNFADVEAAVRSTYGADAATIRSVGKLPLAGPQDSVLLEKVGK